MRCRIKIFLKELILDWDELNIAAKSLILIGMLILFSAVFVTMYKSNDWEIYQRTQIILRTSLASIFGYVLSSNINKKNNYKLKTDKKQIEGTMKYEEVEQVEQVMTTKGLEEDLIEEINEKCKFKDKKLQNSYENENVVQVSIAFIIILVSLGVIIMNCFCVFIVDNAVLSQFRDLMCTSMGFLLGEAKIKI